MVIGGRHVGIPVTNLEKAMAFYCGLLGFKTKTNEIEEGPFIETITGIEGAKIHIAKLVAPDGWTLELLHYLDSTGKPRVSPRLNDLGCAHIALTVDNIDAQYKKLQKENVLFVGAPASSPTGMAKVAFCQDPDGNYIELVEMLTTKTELRSESRCTNSH